MSHRWWQKHRLQLTLVLDADYDVTVRGRKFRFMKHLLPQLENLLTVPKENILFLDLRKGSIILNFLLMSRNFHGLSLSNTSLLDLDGRPMRVAKATVTKTPDGILRLPLPGLLLRRSGGKQGRRQLQRNLAAATTSPGGELMVRDFHPAISCSIRRARCQITGKGSRLLLAIVSSKASEGVVKKSLRRIKRKRWPNGHRLMLASATSGSTSQFGPAKGKISEPTFFEKGQASVVHKVKHSTSARDSFPRKIFFYNRKRGKYKRRQKWSILSSAKKKNAMRRILQYSEEKGTAMFEREDASSINDNLEEYLDDKADDNEEVTRLNDGEVSLAEMNTGHVNVDGNGRGIHIRNRDGDGNSSLRRGIGGEFDAESVMEMNSASAAVKENATSNIADDRTMHEAATDGAYDATMSSGTHVALNDKRPQNRTMEDSVYSVRYDSNNTTAFKGTVVFRRDVKRSMINRGNINNARNRGMFRIITRKALRWTRSTEAHRNGNYGLNENADATDTEDTDNHFGSGMSFNKKQQTDIDAEIGGNGNQMVSNDIILNLNLSAALSLREHIDESLINSLGDSGAPPSNTSSYYDDDKNNTIKGWDNQTIEEDNSVLGSKETSRNIGNESFNNNTRKTSSADEETRLAGNITTNNDSLTWFVSKSDNENDSSDDVLNPKGTSGNLTLVREIQGSDERSSGEGTSSNSSNRTLNGIVAHRRDGDGNNTFKADRKARNGNDSFQSEDGFENNNITTVALNATNDTHGFPPSNHVSSKNPSFVPLNNVAISNNSENITLVFNTTNDDDDLMMSENDVTKDDETAIYVNYTNYGEGVLSPLHNNTFENSFTTVSNIFRTTLKPANNISNIKNSSLPATLVNNSMYANNSMTQINNIETNNSSTLVNNASSSNNGSRLVNNIFSANTSVIGANNITSFQNNSSSLINVRDINSITARANNTTNNNGLVPVENISADNGNVEVVNYTVNGSRTLAENNITSVNSDISQRSNNATSNNDSALTNRTSNKALGNSSNVTVNYNERNRTYTFNNDEDVEPEMLNNDENNVTKSNSSIGYNNDSGDATHSVLGNTVLNSSVTSISNDSLLTISNNQVPAKHGDEATTKEDNVTNFYRSGIENETISDDSDEKFASDSSSDPSEKEMRHAVNRNGSENNGTLFPESLEPHNTVRRNTGEMDWVEFPNGTILWKGFTYESSEWNATSKVAAGRGGESSDGSINRAETNTEGNVELNDVGRDEDAINRSDFDSDVNPRNNGDHTQGNSSEDTDTRNNTENNVKEMNNDGFFDEGNYTRMNEDNNNVISNAEQGNSRNNVFNRNDNESDNAAENSVSNFNYNNSASGNKGVNGSISVTNNDVPNTSNNASDSNDLSANNSSRDDADDERGFSESSGFSGGDKERDLNASSPNNAQNETRIKRFDGGGGVGLGGSIRGGIGGAEFGGDVSVTANGDAEIGGTGAGVNASVNADFGLGSNPDQSPTETQNPDPPDADPEENGDDGVTEAEVTNNSKGEDNVVTEPTIREDVSSDNSEENTAPGEEGINVEDSNPTTVVFNFDADEAEEENEEPTEPTEMVFVTTSFIGTDETSTSKELNSISTGNPEPFNERGETTSPAAIATTTSATSSSSTTKEFDPTTSISPDNTFTGSVTTTVRSSTTTSPDITTTTVLITNPSSTTSNPNPITSTSSSSPITSTSNPNPITSTSSINQITSTSNPNPITSTSSSNPITSTSNPNPITSTSSSNPITSTSNPNPITSTSSSNPITSTSSSNPITNTPNLNTITSTSNPNSITSTSSSNTITSTSNPNSITSTSSSNAITSTSNPNPITSVSSSNTITSTSNPNPVTSTSTSNSITSTSNPNPVTSTSSSNSITSTSIPNPNRTDPNSSTSTSNPIPRTSTTSPNPSASTSPNPSTSTSPNPSTSTSPNPSTSTSPNPSTSTSHNPSTSTSPNPSTSTSPNPSTSTSPNPSTSTSPSPSTSASSRNPSANTVITNPSSATAPITNSPLPSSPNPGNTSAESGSSVSPSESVSSSAEPKVTTEAFVIPFHFTIDADYDVVVSTRKEEFEESLTLQLARAMRVPLSCIQDLEVKRGSVDVTFNLVPDPNLGHLADEKALRSAADELKRLIDSGRLDLTDPDGNTLVVVPLDPPTTPIPAYEMENTTLILGVVIGVFILTIIMVVITAIIVKRKNNAEHRLSPIEEARRKLPSYRDIPFQEALYVKGSGRSPIVGKYSYDSGQWLGPGPEPKTPAPCAASYRPPTDLEIRSTRRPSTTVRERLKLNWDVDWDQIESNR